MDNVKQKLYTSNKALWQMYQKNKIHTRSFCGLGVAVHGGSSLPLKYDLLFRSPKQHGVEKRLKQLEFMISTPISYGGL